MKNINRYTSDHLTDWIVNCDLCGAPVWHSNTVLLEPETGFGGALVCADHQIPIDFGLVPWVVPPEQGVPETRILQNFNDDNSTNDITGKTPWDISSNDPLSSN